MTIKSSKEYHLIYIFSIFLVIGVSFLFWNITDHNIYILLLSLVLIVPLIRAEVAIGRTFIMNENGCTVCFLWYSHTYLWEELQTKRLEDMKDSVGIQEGRSFYTGAAIFSHRKVGKPLRLMPTDYSVFLHPMSFIFVYFKPEKSPPKWTLVYSGIYEVDKDLFIKKMSEWGVMLQ